jgi:predicted ATPase
VVQTSSARLASRCGNLFPLPVLKSINISLCNGNSPESAFSYAAYGMLLCGELDDPPLGYEFGKLAVAMNDQFDDIALKSRGNVHPPLE